MALEKKKIDRLLQENSQIFRIIFTVSPPTYSFDFTFTSAMSAFVAARLRLHYDTAKLKQEIPWGALV